MSRPRYWWYGNVVRSIRAYPALREAKLAAQSQSVTANYSAQPRSGSAGRNTERAALRQLSEQEERELIAIELAIEDTGRRRDGKEILRMVELVDWRGWTVEAAARHLHMSRNTAQALRAKFIYAVAQKHGWL